MISITSSRSLRRFAASTAAAGVAALLAGCSVLPDPVVDPTRYFLLQSSRTSPVTPAPAAEGASVGLRPVELPAYLRSTRNLVVRGGVNEVQYEDYARWAEPLETGILQQVQQAVLASGKVRSAEIGSAAAFATRDFEVSIRVQRCEGLRQGANATVLFEAIYQISSPAQEGRILVTREFRATPAPWNGSDFSQLASRLSDAAAELGREIAANLPK